VGPGLQQRIFVDVTGIPPMNRPHLVSAFPSNTSGVTRSSRSNLHLRKSCYLDDSLMCGSPRLHNIIPFLLLIVALTSHSLSCFGHVSALLRNYPACCSCVLWLYLFASYLSSLTVRTWTFGCSVLLIVPRSNDECLYLLYVDRSKEYHICV